VNLRPGTRWRSARGSTEVVVVRASASDVALECDGVPMQPVETASAPVDGDAPGTPDVTVLLGKRYEYPDHGIEVLCTKPGPGPLSIAGVEMSVKGAKALPSSD
jgi:hypothetical protein